MGTESDIDKRAAAARSPRWTRAAMLLTVVVLVVGALVGGWFWLRHDLVSTSCTLEAVISVDGEPPTYEDMLALGKSEHCASQYPRQSEVDDRRAS